MLNEYNGWMGVRATLRIAYSNKKEENIKRGERERKRKKHRKKETKKKKERVRRK